MPAHQILLLYGGQPRCQGVTNLSEYPLPVAATLLSEKRVTGIPGAVLSAEQPAPVGNVFQSDPRGTPQRAGEMSDGGVRRDHEVEAFHDQPRCRIPLPISLSASREANYRAVPR